MRLLKLLLLTLLVVGTMNSCIKDHSGVPVNTTGNSRGCIECDGYEVGEKFSIDGVNYTVADRYMLDIALNNGADLTKFCTSKVTNMSNMFYNAQAFNQNISNWDVSNVTDMSNMFYNAEAFNQNISNWDVSKVTDMSNMFSHAPAFNQNIGDWDVSNVTDMTGMFFAATSFNQDIGSWDVSNVTDMRQMFYYAQTFNQDLSKWCVKNFSYKPIDFSSNSALTFKNHPIWGTCP